MPQKQKPKIKNIEIEDELIEEELEEEINEQNFSYLNPIEKLLDRNINQKDVDYLKNAGYNTIEGFLNETKNQLNKKNIKGLNDNKIEKLITTCKEFISKNFLKATEIYDYRMSMPKISAGCESLNNLLNGGFEIGSITEVFGEFRTGKTQLCLSACVHCQLSVKKGGLGKGVIFIDTENTFRPERIFAISEKLGLDGRAILDNIYVSQPKNVDEMMDNLTLITAYIMENNIGLIVVDCAMHLYRADYIGRGELSIRQNHLCLFLRKLHKISLTFKLAVIMTNQVVAQVDGMSMFGDNKKPVGGHIFAHASTTRLYLRKGKNNSRICKVYDSPLLPESEAVFLITEFGLEDES